MDKKYELIFCIINAGFADTVMFAARKAGASGGTILKGRGIAGREAQEQFKINIQPEKEIVMILCRQEDKMNIMKAIADSCGMKSEAQGLVISLPVETVVGLD